MKISDIKWGDDSAENDPLLLKYFVNSEAYRRIKCFSKDIVIGRKGSGKSALRKKLEEDLGADKDLHVVGVCPKHNSIRNILNDEDLKAGFGQEIFFQQTWLRQLYLDALCRIGHSAKSKYCADSEAFARVITQQLNRTSKDFVENIADVLSKVKAKVGNLGEFGVMVEKELRNVADLDSLEHHFTQIAKGGARIVFTVDDLDLGWDNSEIANNLLLGLLSASNYIKSLSPNVHCIIFIREDVYDLILTKTQHSDKFRNCERIRWTSPKLISVLDQRIRFNRDELNLPLVNAPFLSVFPSYVGTFYSENWLTERTLFRPRELIQLARYYTENVAGEEPDVIALKAAEGDYSSWKLDDLCSEYSNQYPNLIAVFTYWKEKYFRHKYHLMKSEIEDMALNILSDVKIDDRWFKRLHDSVDVKGFLNVLYEIGFLGDFILGGEGGSRTVYSYSERYEPRFDEVQVHPCFRKAVKTVERISKKKP